MSARIRIAGVGLSLALGAFFTAAIPASANGNGGSGGNAPISLLPSSDGLNLPTLPSSLPINLNLPGLTAPHSAAPPTAPATGTPSSTASATGAQILPSTGNSSLDQAGGTCVSCTGAASGQNSAGASSVPLHALGQDVGGSQQTSTGSSSGNLANAALPPVAGVQFFDWTSSTTSTPEGSSADGRSAVSDLAIALPAVAGNAPFVTLALVPAESSTQSSPGAASAQSSTSAADIDVDGQLHLVLLHTVTDSSTGGHSALITINGNEFGTTSQTPSGNGYQITYPGVGTLDILSLSSVGGLTSASIGSGTTPIGSGTIFGGTSSGGTVPTPAPPATPTPGPSASPTPGGGVLGISTGAIPTTGTVGGVAGIGTSVPLTGTSISIMAFALILVGGLMVMANKRRGSQAVADLVDSD